MKDLNKSRLIYELWNILNSAQQKDLEQIREKAKAKIIVLIDSIKPES